jgi:tetratricopeptide (TPR) repeat protein
MNFQPTCQSLGGIIALLTMTIRTPAAGVQPGLSESLNAVLTAQKLVEEGGPKAIDNAADLIRACWQVSRSYAEALKKMPGSAKYTAALASAAESGSRQARGAMQEAFDSAPYLARNPSIGSLASVIRDHGQDPALLYFVAVTAGELAIRTFQFLEDNYPNSVAFKSLNADLLISQGNYAAAISKYEDLVRLEPRRVDLLHNLAVLYLRQGVWERALAEYRMEKVNSPGQLRAVAGMSECLLYLGRYEEDLQTVATLLASGDTPEWALLDAGSANEHLDHIEAAIRNYERAEKREPENRTTHYHLMQLYKKNGRDDLAKEESAKFEDLKVRASRKE